VTRDVDLTLLTGFGDEYRYVEKLIARFEPRIADATAFALRNRVLLLRSSSGVGIDISLAALPFEHLVVERASDHEMVSGVSLRTCSAEDLLVLKLFASRGIDLRDAEGIAVRHGSSLDWRYVEEQLVPLSEVKEEPEILRQLERVRKLWSDLVERRQ
jgi:hypothetical protein